MVMGNAMNRVRSAFGGTSLARDERGLSTVEYVIILVLIAAAAIGLWVSFGTKLRSKIDAANTKMDDVKIEESK
jgi:Flp pilus assembly pilin Flp